MRGLIAAMLLFALPARAEMAEIVVAEQYGVSILPMMVMERYRAGGQACEGGGAAGAEGAVAAGGGAERDE